MFPSYFASCIPFPSLYASWSRSFIMVPISSCIGLALNDRPVLNCGFHELMQAKSHVYVVTKAFNHPSSSPSSLAYNLKLSTQKKVWVMILFLLCICIQVSSVQWEICEIQKKKKKVEVRKESCLNITQFDKLTFFDALIWFECESEKSDLHDDNDNSMSQKGGG